MICQLQMDAIIQKMPRVSTKPDAIREAALRLFLRSGLRQTSMDAIAAEANVSKQTLYRYYGSKDQLFVEVLGGLTVERLEADVLELMPTGPLSRSQLEATLHALALRMLDFLLDPTYLGLLRAVIAESGDFPELAKLYRESVIPQGAAALERLLTSKQAAGVVKIREVEVALRLFVGPLLSYVLGGLLGDSEGTMKLARAELKPLVRLLVAALSSQGYRS